MKYKYCPVYRNRGSLFLSDFNFSFAKKKKQTAFELALYWKATYSFIDYSGVVEVVE